MEKMHASTQYGDWQGSASADKSDAITLSDYLLEQRLRAQDEFLVGIKLWVGENHRNKLGRVSLSAFVINGAGFDNVASAIASAGASLKLKKIDVDISLEEFVCFFKRFAVSLSDPRFQLEGRSFSTD